MAVDKETLNCWNALMDGHIERGFPGLFQSPHTSPKPPHASPPSSHGTGARPVDEAATTSPSRTAKVTVVAICWPHRNEYDVRNIAAKMRDYGAIVSLPVVISPLSAMIFREWSSNTEMAVDTYGIPYPVAGEAVRPAALFVPVVGFDLHGYRLGYGGGYFDRTIAELSASGKKPVVIGVGYELAKMDTIHPEAHDMPMDFVVTEAGIYRREPGPSQDAALEFIGAPPAGEASKLSSPVCYANEIDPAYFGGKS